MLTFRQIAVPQDVLVREVAGESVLLNLDTETYFGLDEIGTRMWQVLAESKTVQHAYEVLLNEYNVVPEILRNDLESLIEELVSHGLLELGTA